MSNRFSCDKFVQLLEQLSKGILMFYLSLFIPRTDLEVTLSIDFKWILRAFTTQTSERRIPQNSHLCSI